eukprot:m.79544 g.79544  ORF g.79544 m.79544 type:complete len:57 (-) comp25224_c1_seq1:262-432(-)
MYNLVLSPSGSSTITIDVAAHDTASGDGSRSPVADHLRNVQSLPTENKQCCRSHTS